MMFKSLLSLLISLSILMTGCSGIKVAAIPQPPSSAKLRIFVMPVSSTLPKGKWGKSHEEFARGQIRQVERVLQQTGIYEVVREEDIKAALGDQQPMRWELEINGWELARRIAGALHADYAMIMERGAGVNVFLEIVMINATTGNKFGVYIPLDKVRDREDAMLQKQAVGAAYRELFLDAKEDLLATAVRKSRLRVSGPEIAPSALPPSPSTQEVAAERTEPERPAEVSVETRKEADRAPEAVVSPKASAASEKAAAQPSRIIDPVKLKTDVEPQAKGNNLVVYDLDAEEQLKPTALILSEILREELFKSGLFTLVNRENLLKVMEELKFQQSGFTDEKQALQLGKGLAAKQIITGRFGFFGKLYILQAKRIDVQSLDTRGLGSLKCEQEKEEVLLEQMPELVRKLTESR